VEDEDLEAFNQMKKGTRRKEQAFMDTVDLLLKTKNHFFCPLNVHPLPKPFAESSQETVQKHIELLK